MKPRIGVTGGIGSGKSTVSQHFAQLGCALIDADQIARSLTLPGGAAIPIIREQFGDRFINAEQALDRAAMREAVFQDPAYKQRLEGILANPLSFLEIAHNFTESQQLAIFEAIFPLRLDPISTDPKIAYADMRDFFRKMG